MTEHAHAQGFMAAEKYQSQIPAIQTLIALGFKPLSQVEIDKLRGKPRNVVLDDVFVERLLKINCFSHRGKEYPFDLEDGLADRIDSDIDSLLREYATSALIDPDPE